MLAGILERALAPDPDARYATAAQFLADLDDYAMKTKLFASQLRFGSFLSEHFEEELVVGRRERERAAVALEAGPAAEIAPIEEQRAPPSRAEDETAPITPSAPTESGEAPARRREAPSISDEAMALAADDTRPLPASEARQRSSLPWAIALAAGLIFVAVAIAVWIAVG